MESTPAVRVAIVGAGLSGLTAATRLARVGCEVLLLERGNRVGGRATGEEKDGFSLEGVAPLVSATDRRLLTWIRELGLADALLPPRALQVSQVHHGVLRPIETSSLLGIGLIAGVRWWDEPRLLRLPRLTARYRPLLDPERPERAAALDFRSIADFGRLYFGGSLFSHWVCPETTSVYPGDENDLSRVTFLLQRAATREGGSALGALREGLPRLAEHAAREIGVRPGVEVESIAARPGGGYSLECVTESGSGDIEVEAVVLTTPPAVSRRIADPVLVLAERDYFGDVRYGPEISMNVALERPLVPHPEFVRVPRVEASPIECYLAEPSAAGSRAPAGMGLVTLRANRKFTLANEGAGNDVVEKALLASLARFHPRAQGDALFAKLHRRLDSVPLFHVRAYRDLDRFQRVQVDRRRAGRRLYYAGDYLSGPTAENAVASGERAAAALIEDFGLEAEALSGLA